MNKCVKGPRFERSGALLLQKPGKHYRACRAYIVQ